MLRLAWATSLLISLIGCGSDAQRADPSREPEAASIEEVTEPVPDDPETNAPREAERELPRSREPNRPEGGALGQLLEGIGVAVGSRAPSASLRDFEGEALELSRVWSEGPVLLIFYRGGWCPFCNFQIRELTEAYPAMRERGVTPVAISVDRVEESARTRATYTIPFPVLSDSDLAVHRAYRVLSPVDDDEVERLRSMGMDLEGASGRDHHTVAVPAVFLIDAGGVVRFAHADRDYRSRPTVEQLLEAIDRTQATEAL